MIFGTDGVRGVVDKELNAELAYNIGKGMAINLINKNNIRKVIIGKDTRLSGDTYLSAVASGLCDYGIDVVIVGIVPTPVISFLVSKLDFGGGVMITASHNDYTYNGIKVFSDCGEKINKQDEIDIESNIKSDFNKTKFKGKITYDESLVQKYIEYILTAFNCDFSNLTIAIDSANGSNYSLAPYIYEKLNANVIKVCCNNDGLNINKDCGANHIENLTQVVTSTNADFGMSFDGDGDRLRIVLSDGRVISGDDILLYLALYLKEKNRLSNLTVVGTIMTNMGVEDAFNVHGITMLRTDVGDKNVIQLMKEKNLSIGGESSGHICIYEHNPTCDALLNSIFFLKCYNENLINLEQLMLTINKYPSITQNINVDKEFRKDFDNNLSVKSAINILENNNKDCRFVVRPSGTEPVIRIYVEGKSEIKNKEMMEKVIEIIKKAELD